PPVFLSATPQAVDQQFFPGGSLQIHHFLPFSGGWLSKNPSSCNKQTLDVRVPGLFYKKMKNTEIGQ
ncbi:MAG: hypothetical protein J6C40_00085, partial [Lentisphaeria bacterium]|nr:hypothetical protein [Lentisphaeria bacterium]